MSDNTQNVSVKYKISLLIISSKKDPSDVSEMVDVIRVHCWLHHTPNLVYDVINFKYSIKEYLRSKYLNE
jgi:hypothetical protein